ncbi:MAG TPA: GntR family transcriptional regulator [Alphaproteobacteria bacterium]|jgi:GntR family transcriptional regulator|nr:GntR family transcriptional regulator [Alphaproteobacteria bacterium]MDP6270414.1 GntR family transcriptional regulator [Alphaproteobacteria bacterium]MDP7426649.1 GntR family transcriptional regulator [Alphaproteobacteria bacterium]HJM51448.1 GntR family transcriptional regulator [Alphaproteobacteria bacterium]|tara:strand:+ start:2260 stop:3072 length:813 start_codon:yes stop_codon:yes gene_type:complete
MKQPTVASESHKAVRLEALRDTFAGRQDGPGTKAQRFRDAFIETIKLGLWRPDDPVPSEKELLAVLPLSQGTIQAAMRRLSEDGIVVRKRGAGSRISSSGTWGDTPWYMRFRADGETDLASVENVKAAIAEIRGDGAWSAALGARPSFLELQRTLVIAGEFSVLAIAYLDAGRFRPLLDFPQETVGRNHLRHLLHDRFNVPTLRAHETVRLRAAPAGVAEVVGVAANTPVLTLQTVNLSLHEEAIVYQEFHIPPNHFHLDLSRSQGRVSG